MMTQNELKKVLELHKKWLNDDEDGERADLHDADLSWTNLTGADLRGADLSCANLYHASLSDADLSNADLSHADLSDADLSHADLCNANLSGANLSGANLSNADLYNANLFYANLCYASLSGANLRGTKIDFPLACPETGSFEAWKKVVDENKTEFLVHLLIPKEAKRSSATTNKCRCEYADVLSIENIATGETIDEIINNSYQPEIKYRVGETVYPDSWDDNRWNECSHGIHFFVNKQSAIDY